MGNDTTAPLPFDPPDGDPSGGASPAAGAPPRRVFLGDAGPLPDRAARWLLEALPEAERAATLVAVPGGRARLALLESLQRGLAGAPLGAWPELLTVGQLGDTLARPTAEELRADPRRAHDAPRVAARVERSLVWQAAVEALPDAARAVLLPDAADTPAARRALAASLRRLHADLAAADLDGDDLAEGFERAAPDRDRWRLFADLQRRVLRELEQRGLADPHALRRATPRLPARGLPRVVLVGVVDLSPLLEHQLAHRVVQVDLALPGDEPEAAPLHDAWGRLIPGFVERRAIPRLLERWTLHANPDAQAEALAAALDARRARVDAGALALALPDAELHAPVRRRLAERGLGLAESAGRPWRRAAVARWLAALREHLTQRTAASLAALLRHPAVEAWLAARGVPSPARRLDGYHADHLPAGLPRRWRSVDGKRRTQRRAAELGAAVTALGELLGPLGDTRARPAHELVDALRAVLAALHDAPGHDGLFADAAARRLRDVLADAARLPAEPGLRPADFLALLEESLADAKVPAAPAARGPELLGLGELPFASADTLLLAGFQEGAVGSAPRGHPWLPDGLRAELGLPCAAARRARDHWALLAAVARGVDLRLFSGRRSREGDPRRPSRLAFHGDDATALAAAAHALQAAEEPPPPAPGGDGPAPAPLLPPSLPPVEVLSVTTFDAFLASPYQCFVQRILRRDAEDDAAHELDGGAFGSLAHALLEDFGRSELAASTDAEALAAWFDAELDRVARQRFGPEAAPAVRLQLRQLAWRLRHFAAWQARHVAEGWVLREVEWKPQEPVQVTLGDQRVALRGRIDRIDVHPDGRWLLIDYKTGERGDGPNTDHGGRHGVWKKLQLPLYLELVGELRRAWGLGLPELAYVVLPKDAVANPLKHARWKPHELAHARLTAGEIVRRLRAGEVRELGAGRFLAEDPSLRALSGVGLVGGPRAERLGALVPFEEPPADDAPGADTEASS